MENKIIITIAIILGIILIGISGVYAYNYVSDRAYNLGVQNAVLLINQQIINSLNKNGYIPFMFVDNNNQTQQIKLVPYQE